MKIKLKQFELKKVEIDPIDFDLPTEPAYFYEPHVRRFIKIIPIYTTWNKKNGKEEEVWTFEITNVYLSKCSIEKFNIHLSELESPYSEHKPSNALFIKHWLEGNNFEKTTKERFDNQLSEAFRKINE
jgi:hypothetical protein